jgi:hypothetical protein
VGVSVTIPLQRVRSIEATDTPNNFMKSRRVRDKVLSHSDRTAVLSLDGAAQWKVPHFYHKQSVPPAKLTGKPMNKRQKETSYKQTGHFPHDEAFMDLREESRLLGRF